MASPISYNDMVNAIKNAYGGNSSLTWSEVSQALARGGCTTDNYLEYLEQFPGTFDVVANADGSIRSVSVNAWSSVFDGASWEAAEAIGEVNSNLVPATASGGSGTLVTIPGSPIVDPATKGITFTQGMTQAGNFVMKEVMPAVAAAGIGIKLGKFIDGSIYNIGKAMGLNPPSALDPSTWDSITAGDNSTASRLFNMVFGIDDSGNTQAYVDAIAFAYMAQWMSTQGFFNTSSKEYRLDNPPDGYPSSFSFTNTVLAYRPTVNPPLILEIGTINPDGFIYSFNDDGHTFWSASRADTSTGGVEVKTIIQGNYSMTQWAGGSLRATPGGVNYYEWGAITFNSSTAPRYLDNAGKNVPISILAQYFFDGTLVSNGQPDGVSDQSGANLPDTTDWNSPQNTLESLRQQYPELFENEVTQQVVQPDGTIREYHYIPIGFPEEDGSTGTQTQTQTQVDPDTSTQTLIDTLIQILTQTQPQTDTDLPTSPPTDNPPDTGDGDTPIAPVPTGSASSLWRVYNPTQSELDSFGAWLWSSDLVEQIKKLFSNPMESIIGVHKVFASPSIGGTATIKCGYIDSGVSSKYISDQYSHIDCGTVNLPEYFGNVFDYDPFTKVSLFLPFIGIVPLNVADVMRSSITVKYHVDVITGACLAEVSVRRDGAGGILYTYSGSAIVSYPLSSGSYAGIIGGVLSIAAGIAGTIATEGAMAPALLGAASSATRLHTTVQRSGDFSGAPGAMGGKTPYLIITRPQTRMAGSYETYDGVGANYTSRLSACSGYVRVKEVHLKVPDAYESEIKEIESLLHSGILI